MQVRADDIVRVVNRGEAPITVGWNNREYRLVPERDTFIPAACAFTWFGDPRAAATFQSILDPDGSRQFVVDRATEVRRLRIKWGAGLAGNEDNFDEVAIPQIEVWSAEGERYITVLDDPEGKNVMAATVSAQDDEQMRALLASQQRQIEMMKTHLGLNEDDAVAASNEAELPSDGASELEPVE